MMQNGVYFITIFGCQVIQNFVLCKIFRGLVMSQDCLKMTHNDKVWNTCTNTQSTVLKFYNADVLRELHIVIVVMMSPQQHLLPDLYLPKIKKNTLLFLQRTSFLVLMLCDVHIRSHLLNEHKEQITLYLKVGNSDFTTVQEPIVFPWKCHKGHAMELCDEYNNCTKFQFFR